MNSKVQQSEKQETSAPVLTRPSSGARGRLHATPRTEARLRQLQRSIGNQRVSRMLQKKLVVGSASDEYEREADRVAEAVTSRSSQSAAPHVFMLAPQQPSSLQQECSCGGTCSRCQEEGEKLHRQAESSTAPSQPVNDAPPIVDEVLGSPGQPLDSVTRAYFEPRFGYDFSAVRVHTDSQASRAVESVDALAYTVGHDIVFKGGEYSPRSENGQHLLAHELSHVVQQRQQTSLQMQEEKHPKDKRKHKPSQPKAQETKKEEMVDTTSPSSGALKALKAAQEWYKQNNPAIWYDSWGNDLRDNNLNGKIDDRSEQRLSDGSHYGGLFDAMVCKDPSDTTDYCPKTDQSKIKVSYKVCIDLPIEAYKRPE